MLAQNRHLPEFYRLPGKHIMAGAVSLHDYPPELRQFAGIHLYSIQCDGIANVICVCPMYSEPLHIL
jgi:hypothetical protein